MPTSFTDTDLMRHTTTDIVAIFNMISSGTMSADDLYSSTEHTSETIDHALHVLSEELHVIHLPDSSATNITVHSKDDLTCIADTQLRAYVENSVRGIHYPECIPVSLLTCGSPYHVTNEEMKNIVRSMSVRGLLEYSAIDNTVASVTQGY